MNVCDLSTISDRAHGLYRLDVRRKNTGDEEHIWKQAPNAICGP